MDRSRRGFVIGLFLLCSAALLSGQSATQTPPPISLSPEQMEVFLLKADIRARKKTSKGVTAPVRATLSDGQMTHDAQIQNVDIAKLVYEAGSASEMNFKDTYRFNIGGYRLARMLGLGNVPMSVKRTVDNKPAAMTWWIDDVQFDEEGRLKQKTALGPNPDRTSKLLHVMRVWDELIQNRDRNQGNMIWTNDWTLWMIDHTRAFRLGKKLLKPERLTRCDRSLLEAMRALTLESLTAAMGDIIQKDELEALLVRRDVIVKLFEDRIATRGEAAVLFSM